MRERYLAAPTFPEYLETVEANRELWLALAERARVPEEFLREARGIGGPWHLLALSEDWCGDAVNTLPAAARLVEAVPGLELRVLGRDANPDLMDAHLTNGSRSIPVVILFDEDFVERGWWGPRPAALQRWVVEEGLALPKEERYREVRRWYARDRGRSTVREILDLVREEAILERGVGRS